MDFNYDKLYDVLNSNKTFCLNKNSNQVSHVNTKENEYFRFSLILKDLLPNNYDFVKNEQENKLLIINDKDNFEIVFYDKYAIITIVVGDNIENYFITYDERCKIVNYYKKFINRNKKHLIMIGGSFNPITIAHYEMAKAMVQNIDDSYVVFVPTCDYYIKSFKKYPNESLLKETYRYQLLTETTLYDLSIIVDDIEMLEKREKTKTFRTVFQIKEKYKPKEISFSIGSDDLKHMSKWWCVEGLLSLATCIVVARNILDIENEIKKYKFFENKLNRFSYLSYKNEYSTLSSTLVRQLMLEGKDEEIKKLIPLRAYYSLMGMVENIRLNKIKCEKNELLKLFTQSLEGEFKYE